VCCAIVATSGAIARHGAHHGAQKSTTTGSVDLVTSASNEAASGTSIGADGAGSGVPHLPQRVGRSNVA
jgi:hypothetical protein